MNTFILVFLTLGSFTSRAVEVSQIGVKIDSHPPLALDAKLKSNQILGICDGHQYTNQAELDGCERNVSARAPNTFISGQSRLTSPSRPVPTTELEH